MKNPLAKKIIIIFSVIVGIILTAVTITLVTGNTLTPSLSNPDEVFYQRTDADGNVIYTITNEELFEEIKSNDGLEQLLNKVDLYMLQDYLAELTDQEILDRITLLTYGTIDQEEIDALDADEKAELEATFQQNIVLAGYTNSETEYASLSLAREAYARYAVELDGDITDDAIGDEYALKWFEDIQAIKIRFTSPLDLKDVMRHFNLLSYASTEFRRYLGFKYADETLTRWDGSDLILEACRTIDTYYFDGNDNILNLDNEIVYTKGTDIYTDASANVYTMDAEGDLIDSSSIEVLNHSFIFDTNDEAKTYKNNNTTYYTISKTDPYDANEDAVVKNSTDTVVYTIDSDGKVWDGATEITDLVINKVYTPIKDITTVTKNNSAAMTDQEILSAFLDMYNYVYGEYRDELDRESTAEELIALNNEYLIQNFDEVNAVQTALAKYMFFTLDLEDDQLPCYSPVAKSFNGSNDTATYLIYKLTQPEKTNIYKQMIDYVVENVGKLIPAQTTANIALPTSGWYKSTISWVSSSNSTVLTTAGVVTRAEHDTTITLTYNVTCKGVTRSAQTVSVVVLGTSSTGSTSELGTVADTQITVETILADADLYAEIEQSLIDDLMAGTSAKTTINKKLAAMRAEYGFQIYDYYLGIDYTSVATDYDTETKGHKTNIATLSGRPGYLGAAGVSEEITITADDLMDFCLTKNAALYTLYSIQFKEMIYSQYFQDAFGTQTDLKKNKSDRMEEMRDTITYLKQGIYPYYNTTDADGNSKYNSFLEFAYAQYGTKSEYQLLQYFVEGAIQPFIINEATDEYALLDLLNDTLLDYYNNFFSLYVTHILIYLDFDEDGSPDDFNEYVAAQETAGTQAVFSDKLAALETAIQEYLDNEDEDHDFESLITAYNDATRDDVTWGEFKQYGFCVMYEDLNQTNDDDEPVSIQYSGTYGVKDTYVPEFVEALHSYYVDYLDPENLTKDELRTDGVTTEYGRHFMLLEKGDYFNTLTCEWTEADSENPVYTVGSENPFASPSATQVELYAKYYFLNTVYDLKDEDILAQYDVPNLPPTVTTALDFYFQDLLESLYVVGVVNIRTADLMKSGTFLGSGYTDLSNTELQTMLTEVRDIYYEALFGKYSD